MAVTLAPEAKPIPEEKLIVMPDHTHLPESDGAVVENFLEHPQSMLLTDSVLPVLRRLHPDDNFCIGQNSAIYWKFTDPPFDGSKAPDWYYVPNRPPLLNGRYRRSYVLWQEIIAPTILIEYVSGDGSEELDQTPYHGKFWVYEQAIRAPYYVIYDAFRERLNVFRLNGGHYQPVPPNERGHYPIEPLDLELGLWRGKFLNHEAPWLRWWDTNGKLLPTHEERIELEQQQIEQERHRAEQERQRAEYEQQRAEQERQRAEQEQQRAQKLADRLRELGVDPDQV